MTLAKKEGFTLIELIVTISIIGILTVIGYSSYKGFISKSEEAACLQQHNDIKNVIQSKFIEGNSRSGDAIMYHSTINADGTQGPSICYQYFLGSHSPTTNIRQIVGSSDAVSSLCSQSPGGGSETIYFDHIYRLGFRNCSNFGDHPYEGVSCSGKECPALQTRGRGLLQGWSKDDHVKGQTIFDCGESAGLENQFRCYIGTKVSDDKIVEEYISK